MVDKDTSDNTIYQAMETALYTLAEHHDSPPSLKELAQTCGMSEFHFQKLFTRWVGISPKRFSQFLSKEYIKSLLDAGMKPLDACYQAGLSGPGRLHELFINTEAMSPSQYKNLGKGLHIRYGIHDSPFGRYLLAVTDKGICQMTFISDNQDYVLEELHNNWSLASLTDDKSFTQQFHDRIFGSAPGEYDPLTLILKGTNFQIQVWQALLKIPFGKIASYEDIAAFSGKPSATRACASAIARNNIAWLVPCHRVVRKIGESGQYRWGASRKKLILAYEGAASL